MEIKNEFMLLDQKHKETWHASNLMERARRGGSIRVEVGAVTRAQLEGLFKLS